MSYYASESVIRPLTHQDVQSLRELDGLAFGESDQYDSTFYESIIASDDFDALVVSNETGAIMAWVLVDLAHRPIRVRSLSVHPAFQRRGLASKLMEHVLNSHRKSIDLLVEPGNHAAMNLYRKLGFEVTDADPEMPHRTRMVIGV